MGEPDVNYPDEGKASGCLCYLPGTVSVQEEKDEKEEEK